MLRTGSVMLTSFVPPPSAGLLAADTVPGVTGEPEVAAITAAATTAAAILIINLHFMFRPFRPSNRNLDPTTVLRWHDSAMLIVIQFESSARKLGSANFNGGIASDKKTGSQIIGSNRLGESN